MTLSATALSAFAAASAQASAIGLSGGTVALLDAAGATLASVSLGVPTAVGAVTTMAGFPKVTAGTPGVIASASYKNSAGANWKSGMSVGLIGSGAQVIVSSMTITDGQSITVSSAILTHTAN